MEVRWDSLQWRRTEQDKCSEAQMAKWVVKMKSRAAPPPAFNPTATMYRWWLIGESSMFLACKSAKLFELSCGSLVQYNASCTIHMQSLVLVEICHYPVAMFITLLLCSLSNHTVKTLNKLSLAQRSSLGNHVTAIECPIQLGAILKEQPNRNSVSISSNDKWLQMWSVTSTVNEEWISSSTEYFWKLPQNVQQYRSVRWEHGQVR